MAGEPTQIKVSQNRSAIAPPAQTVHLFASLCCSETALRDTTSSGSTAVEYRAVQCERHAAMAPRGDGIEEITPEMRKRLL